MVKISVVMSVYNGALYLKEAVDSILEQTCQDFEFLIVDDASVDQTPRILREYAQADHRMRIITNDHNLGLTKSLNKALALARGVYIAHMDSDDIAMPERLEKQALFLDRNPEVGMVGSWYYFLNERGEKIGLKQVPAHDRDLRKALIKMNIFCHSSVKIRKAVLELAAFYDEHWASAQDYELYFRIAKHGKLANIGEPLVSWRIRKDGISFAKAREQKWNAMRAQIKAIREGQYDLFRTVYLIRPALALITPYAAKQIFKKYLLKKSYL